MQREITYELTPELARIGVRRFIFRNTRLFHIYFPIIMVIGIAGLVVGKGEVIWWFLTVFPIFYALMWLHYYIQMTKIIDENPDRSVTVRFAPDSITFQSSESSSTMKWPRIKMLWSFPDVLLVFFYGRGLYAMIPVAPLGEELRHFIQDKVKENGGKVV